MNWLRILLDRTAVLFLGVAAGAAIGYAFGTGNETKDAVSLAPQAAPTSASPAIAPPPPTAASAGSASVVPPAAASGPAAAPAAAAAADPVPVDPPTDQLAATVKN